MTIEIHQPELEALIQQRIDSGAFQSIEDMLLHARPQVAAGDSTAAEKLFA